MKKITPQEDLEVDKVHIPETQPHQQEISPESLEQRFFEESSILFNAEKELLSAQEKQAREDAEIITLQDGRQFTIGELKLLSNERRPYSPLFPNSVPYFSEIYRLNGWGHLDPKNYNKPSIVGKWTNEMIYGRFPKEILPALQYLNPFTGKFRKDKHFQYLTEEGQQFVVQYRDETIEIMKKCSDWYEFRQKLHDAYGVPYQIQLFGGNE